MQVVLDPAVVHGATVTGVDSSRTPLGRVERVYVDAASGVPTWALVDGAGLGGHRCLVPLSGARLDGPVLRVPYSTAELAWAPHHEPGRELTAADEDELDTYYRGLTAPPPTPKPPTPGFRRPTASPVSASAADSVSAAAAGGQEATVTRSEERLHVGLRTDQVGVARLRTYVTTETVTQTVPVTNEELVVDRQPIPSDATGLLAADGLGEAVREVVLHADRVVTATDTVAVERIRLGTRTVTEQQTVTAELAKENVVFDGVQRSIPSSEGETA